MKYEHNFIKRELFEAYLAGIISKKELFTFLEMYIPGAIFLKEGKYTKEDKKIAELCEKIGYDMLTINVCTIKQASE